MVITPGCGPGEVGSIPTCRPFNKKMRIFCFGDSITYGKWDAKHCGWVQRLRRFLDKNWEIYGDNLVYNLGVSGDTTKNLLTRFEFEIEQRLKEEKEEVLIIFDIGINDSLFF